MLPEDKWNMKCAGKTWITLNNLLSHSHCLIGERWFSAVLMSPSEHQELCFIKKHQFASLTSFMVTATELVSDLSFFLLFNLLTYANTKGSISDTTVVLCQCWLQTNRDTSRFDKADSDLQYTILMILMECRRRQLSALGIQLKMPPCFLCGHEISNV